MTRKLAAALALTALLAVPTTGPQAGTAEEEMKERAHELAREGVERIMQALDLLIDAIPQYEWPEITDDGDIIIKRVPPGEKRKARPEEEEFDRT